MAQCSQSLILHVIESSRIREVLSACSVEIQPVAHSLARVALDRKLTKRPLVNCSLSGFIGV